MIGIENQSKETVLVTQGKLANTFFSRLKGLLGQSQLQTDEGLILQSVKSIHTLFMAFALDVVYLNPDLQVIKLDLARPPYRLGPYVTQAAYVIELPVGTIQASQTELGDQLQFTPNT